MAADSEVVKELLVALGFKIEDVGLKKFNDTLLGINKRAALVAGAIASVAAAADVMVSKFANNFEHLYYLSQRTGQTIANIRGVGFAAGQVGLKFEDMTAALEGMKKAMLYNPGTQGLLRSMGIDPNSKDLLTDFLKQLDKLQKAAGPLMGPVLVDRYSKMMGLDTDTVMQILRFLPEFLDKSQHKKDKDALAGFSPDELQNLAKDAREYENVLRDIKDTYSLLSDILASKMLPYFREFAGAFNEFVADVAHGNWDIFKSAIDGLADSFRPWSEYIGVTADNLERVLKLLDKYHDYLNWHDKLSNAVTGKNMFRSGPEKQVDDLYGGAPRTGAPQQSLVPQGTGLGNVSLQEFYAGLERQYGLPSGMLSRVRQLESNNGKDPLSKKPNSVGALGDFQFIPSTGKAYGLDRASDYLDPEKSGTAAAKYLADLLKQYDGNAYMAAAHYHGEGDRATRYALGAPSSGYSKYALQAAGGANGGPVTIHQKTDIHVTGATDPNATASTIAGHQRRVNSDLVRLYTAQPR